MRRLSIILAAVVVAVGADVVAFDFLTTQGDGMGRTVLLSHPTPTVLVSVPSDGLANGEWRLETGYNRRYDLADLDQFFIAGSYRWRSLTGSLGLSTLGKSDTYLETAGKLGLAYHRNRLTVGAAISGRKLEFGGGYAGLNAISLGIGATVRTKYVLLSIVGDNVNTPLFHAYAVEISPVYALHGEFVGAESYSITGRITLERDKDAQLGLGQKIFISRSGAVFWGIGTKPLEYGGGVELAYKAGILSYAFSIHPVLGFSQTISISVGGGFAPRDKTDEFK
jgi:hypothetical protein